MNNSFSVRILAIISVLIVGSMGTSCRSTRIPQSFEASGLDPEIARYLDAAIDTLRRVSRHSNTVDWEALRAGARQLSDGARQPRDVYPVVDWLLSSVDRHSFLQSSRFGVRDAALGNGIAYVRVPSWGSTAMQPTLSDSLQTMIRRQDEAGACRWIVDLRMNGGGNVWPMLAGIGPLLGDSLVGGSTSPRGRASWKYVNGSSVLVKEDGTEQRLVTATNPVQRLQVSQPPIAVLIDSGTGSSGEMIAVAFRGRPRTLFFGLPTAGVSTTNEGFRLPDGVNMVITTGAFVDRQGATYGVPIQPDVRVRSPLHGPSMLRGDPIVRAALTWLQGESCE